MDLSGIVAAATAHPALASALASAFAGIATLTALLFARRAGADGVGVVGSFAAASLLAATLLHLFPDAASMSVHAGLSALAGFALVYGLAALTSGPQSAPIAAAAAPMIGIGVHSFLDGALHATLFAVDLHTGLATAPGLVLHEVAETTLLFMLMRRAGLGNWSAAGLAFIGAVATTPLGALASEGPIASLPDHQLGWALGASAGSLIFLSVSHLSESLSEGRRWPQVAAFAAGVAVTAFLLAGPLFDHNGHDFHHDEPGEHRHADHHAASAEH